MSDLSVLVQHPALLIAHYIEHVCTPEVRGVIKAHEIFYKKRPDTVCYLTAAALAWLISGKDLAAPFSGVWDAAAATKGIHRVVAFATDADCFEDTLEHVLIVYGDEWVVDSHFMRGQTAQISPITKLQEFAHFESRTIYFSPAPGIEQRAARIQKN